MKGLNIPTLAGLALVAGLAGGCPKKQVLEVPEVAAEKVKLTPYRQVPVTKFVKECARTKSAAREKALSLVRDEIYDSEVTPIVIDGHEIKAWGKKAIIDYNLLDESCVTTHRVKFKPGEVEGEVCAWVWVYRDFIACVPE